MKDHTTKNTGTSRRTKELRGETQGWQDKVGASLDAHWLHPLSLFLASCSVSARAGIPNLWAEDRHLPCQISGVFD